MSVCDADGRKRHPRGEGHPISCDQVAWLLGIAERYIPQDSFPRISRQREMKKFAMLYEIMEICQLKFDDHNALYNAIPFEVKPDYFGEERLKEEERVD